MDKFIEAIANGNFESILALITTLISGGFGTALVVIATKFLHYKKSVKETIVEMKKELLPEAKQLTEKLKTDIVGELRSDIKVLAESIALSTANDPTSKIAVIDNVSKIGVSKKVKEETTKAVVEEIKTKEEKKEELNKAVEALETNTLENL